MLYQQRVNGYKGDLKSFIRENMTEVEIAKTLKNATFAANILRSRMIFDMCHHYNMKWENLNWVNTFRHPKEAGRMFKEVEQYSGSYSEKIWKWANDGTGKLPFHY